MKQFDPGFAHSYPRQRGLTESFNSEGQRSIKDRLNRPVVNVPESVGFIAELVDNHVEYVIPDDARELSQHIRNIKREQQAIMTGILLGFRLVAVNEVLGGVPEDTVTDRFTIYSSKTYKKFGGSDMRLLPPYDRLGLNLEDSLEVVQNDLKLIDVSSIGLNFDIDLFVSSVKSGFYHVG